MLKIASKSWDLEPENYFFLQSIKGSVQRESLMLCKVSGKHVQNQWLQESQQILWVEVEPVKAFSESQRSVGLGTVHRQEDWPN